MNYTIELSKRSYKYLEKLDKKSKENLKSPTTPNRKSSQS
ncbi:hypothetical protein FHR92_005051 [Fontibacillus solani]|uniref:Uncharacterized protein n=1 Tax=Fontibacillus solani TaxID=1572857 RepID=A0A7W3XUE4_9BACL|nr:hypothetical protein [Fontibacillus solani]